MTYYIPEKTIISGSLLLGSGINPDIVLSENLTLYPTTIFNNNSGNIDFKIKSTGTNFLFYDASTGRLGLNTSAPDKGFHLITECSNDGLKLESQTNCVTGVSILLQHNPGSSPTADSYPATIMLAGRDNNSNQINYGKIRSKAKNVTTGSTLGELLFYIDDNTTDLNSLRLSKTMVVAGTQNTITSGSNNYQVMGNLNEANGTYFVVLGNNNYNDPTKNSVTIGNNNSSYANFNQMIGRGIVCSGSGNAVYGYDILHSGSLGWSLAGSSRFIGDNAIIMGQSIRGTGLSDIIIGQSNTVSGDLNIVMGSSHSIIANKLISIGRSNSVSANTGIIIGNSNSVVGDKNIVLGNNLSLQSSNLFIVGENITANNVSDSLILEKDISISDATGMVVVGRGNKITSTNNSVSINGYKNTINGTVLSTSIVGNNNLINGASGSIIIGTTNTSSGTINNSISLGHKNYLGGTSHNNIQIGNLNNQLGQRLLNDGSITGVIGANSNSLANTVAVGNQNIINIGNTCVAFGNKNYATDSLFSTSIGNFNVLKNGEASLSIGTANHTVGGDQISFGNSNSLYGSSNILISPRSATVFGSNAICIGNNSFVSNGIVMGNSNVLYGDNNTIIGKNNTVGSLKYLFSSTLSGSTIDSLTIAGAITFIVGDVILIYVYNPVGSDNISYYTRTISTVTYNSGSNTTLINFTGGNISISSNYKNNPSTFDTALIFTATSTITGYVLKINEGSNNYVYGDNNTLVNATPVGGIIGVNTVVGSGNTITGTRNVIIGNSLTHTGSSSLVMGATSASRIIIGDNIIFNSGLAQSYAYFCGQTANTIAGTFDLVNRRLGIKTASPRSEIDVSGTITTANLRIGLSSPTNSVLTCDGQGNTSWASQNSMSGLNSGLIYKVSDSISSGISTIRYDPLNLRITNYNLVDLVADNPYPAMTTQTNQGIVLNVDHCYNDEIFGLTIYGSGVSTYPILFDTDFPNNKIKLGGTTQTSNLIINGTTNINSTITTNTSLTGTILTVDRSSYQLKPHNLFPNTFIHSSATIAQTGYKTVRWFPTEKVFCLSDNATHTDISNSFVSTDYNIMLSTSPSYQTVFNRLGSGSPGSGSGFVVLYSEGNSTQKGFRIDYNTKQVGINTTPKELTEIKVDSTSPTSPSLVVKGSIFAEGLRFGLSSSSGYVMASVDISGNMGLRPVGLGLLTNVIKYPLATSTVNSIDYLGLSDKTPGGQTFNATTDVGRTLVWNGSSNGWIPASGFRILNPGSGTTSSNNILFGPHARNDYLTTKDIQIYSGASFHRTDSTYYGSSQNVWYYLRGRTIGATSSKLVTDWSIDNTTTEDNTNVIKFPISNQSNLCWYYNITISFIAKNSSNDTYAGTAVLKGAYKKVTGDTVTVVGTPIVDYIRDSQLASVAVSVSIGGTNSYISLDVTGIAGYTIYYSATAVVNQLSLPTIPLT